ncbi:MAG: hypothetical protein MUC87_00305 [Bacteroidia bacterium]|jgi:dTDP-4-dehydrorhamnose reductase|nr:hypothetical protein [Bacteroidia bacterium]
MAARTRNKTRILILGANGQVGRVLFYALQSYFPQAEIMGAVRPAHFHFEGVGAGGRAHSVIYDIHRQPWSGGNVDVVINCIGLMQGSEKELFHAHTGTSLALLQNRAAMGNPAIIQVSALGAGGNNPSAFLRSKALADAAILGQERTWVIRPSILCTPQTMLVKRIKKLRKLSALLARNLWLPASVLHTKIQPVMPADFAATVAAVIENQPTQRIIEAAGKEVYDFADLFALAGVRTHIMPRKLFEIAAFMLRPLIRTFISAEEMKLMGINNTSDAGHIYHISGCEAQSTASFWKQQLHPDIRTRTDFSTVFA